MSDLPVTIHSEAGLPVAIHNESGLPVAIYNGQQQVSHSHYG